MGTFGVKSASDERFCPSTVYDQIILRMCKLISKKA